MEIQYLSDIHLEFIQDILKIERKAPILALLGDIGNPWTRNYKKFIEYVGELFDVVLVVAGNHEYYSLNEIHSYQETNQYLHNFYDNFENVYFLDNESVVIDGIRFIGSTLWTHIPQDKHEIVQRTITDYKMIFDKPLNFNKIFQHEKLITPSFTSLLHEIAVKYINNQLELDSTTPTIILTHHIPLDTNDFIPLKFHNDLRNVAYFTNLEPMIKKPIIAWFFGHCHEPIEYVYNGVKLQSNPMGYERENSMFIQKSILL